MMTVFHSLLKSAIGHLNDLLKLPSSNKNLLMIMQDALLCINLIKVNEPDFKNKFQELQTVRNKLVHVFLILYFEAKFPESPSPQDIEKDLAEKKVFFKELYKDFNAYLSGEYKSEFKNKKILQAELKLSQLEMLIRFYYALLSLEQLPQTLPELNNYLMGVYVVAELTPKINVELPLDNFQDCLEKVNCLRNFLEHEIFKPEIYSELSTFNTQEGYSQAILKIIQAGFYQQNQVKKFKFLTQEEAAILGKLKRYAIAEIDVLLKTDEFLSKKYGPICVISENYQPEIAKTTLNKINELRLCRDEIKQVLFLLDKGKENITQQKIKESILKNQKNIQNLLNFLEAAPIINLFRKPSRDLSYIHVSGCKQTIDQINDILENWEDYSNHEVRHIVDDISPHSLLIDLSFDNLLADKEKLKKIFQEKSDVGKKIFLESIIDLYFKSVLNNNKKIKNKSSAIDIDKLNKKLFFILFDLFNIKPIFLREQKKLLYYLYGINQDAFFAKALEIGAINPNAEVYCDTLNIEPNKDMNLVSVLHHMIKWHFPSRWIAQLIKHPDFDPNQFSNGEPLFFIFAQSFHSYIINHEIIGERSFYSEDEFVDCIVLPFIQHQKFDSERKGFSGHTALYRLLEMLTLKDEKFDLTHCEVLKIKYRRLVLDNLLGERKCSVDLLMRDCCNVTIYQKLFDREEFQYLKEIFSSFESHCLALAKQCLENFHEEQLPKLEKLISFFASDIRMDFLWLKNKMPVIYQEQVKLLQECLLEKIIPSFSGGIFASSNQFNSFIIQCNSPAVISWVHQKTYSLIDFFERSGEFKYFYLRDYYCELGKNEKKINTMMTKLLGSTLWRHQITENQRQFVDHIVPWMKKLKDFMEQVLNICTKLKIISDIQKIPSGQDAALFSLVPRREKLKSELKLLLAEYQEPNSTLSLTNQSKAS